MSRQSFPPQQGATPSIHVQYTDGDFLSQDEHMYQYQLQPDPGLLPTHKAVDPAVAYQYHIQFSHSGYTGATDHPSWFQPYRQPVVIPFHTPPSSSPIPIPTLPGTAVESFSPSPGTSASTPSSGGGASPGVCHRSQPQLNEQTRQWSCGGCNKVFSDKYGAVRHINTVGRKVTCKYCGSKVSSLEFSRRRHFQRESCRKEGLERGFTTRNEEDAFVEDCEDC